MDSIIAKDTLHTYLKSEDGFKYYYVAENKEATYKPAFGDMSISPTVFQIFMEKRSIPRRIPR